MKEKLIFLLDIIRSYKYYYILMLQAPIIGATQMTINGYILKIIVDNFSVNPVCYTKIIKLCFLFVIYLMAMELSWRVSQYGWIKSQPFIKANIAIKVYEHIQNQSYEFFQNVQTGLIVSKIKGIIEGYSNLWSTIHYKLINRILRILFAVISLVFVNVNIFIIVLIWLIIFFMIMIKMSFTLSKLSAEKNEWHHKIMGLIADNILNIYTLFNFGRRKFKLANIKNHLLNKQIAKDCQEIKYSFKMAIIGGILYLFIPIVLFIFIIYLHSRNIISNGDVIFVISLSFYIVDSVLHLLPEITNFVKDMGDFSASFTIMQSLPKLLDKVGSKDIKIHNGNIIFNNISYSYNKDKIILNNLNLSIKSGQKVGIVGKSTLISLLMKNF